MEGFLENIFTVLPALRVDCFIMETRKVIAVDNKIAFYTADERVENSYKWYNW